MFKLLATSKIGRRITANSVETQEIFIKKIVNSVTCSLDNARNARVSEHFSFSLILNSYIIYVRNGFTTGFYGSSFRSKHILYNKTLFTPPADWGIVSALHDFIINIKHFSGNLKWVFSFKNFVVVLFYELKYCIIFSLSRQQQTQNIVIYIYKCIM